MSTHPRPSTDIPVDLSCLHDITDGDTVLEKRIIATFARQAEENLAVLRDSCTQKQGRVWREAAHKFKGSAGSIGANRLSRLCDAAQIFSDAEEGREGLLAQIRDEYAAVRDCLRAAGLLD